MPIVSIQAPTERRTLSTVKLHSGFATDFPGAVTLITYRYEASF
jgi:hypothetical protein